MTHSNNHRPNRTHSPRTQLPLRKGNHQHAPPRRSRCGWLRPMLGVSLLLLSASGQALSQPSEPPDAPPELDKTSAMVAEFCRQRVRASTSTLSANLNQALQDAERCDTELAGFRAESDRLKQEIADLEIQRDRLLQVIDALPAVVREQADLEEGWFTTDTLLRMAPDVLPILLALLLAWLLHIVWTAYNSGRLPREITRRLATDPGFLKLIDQSAAARRGWDDEALLAAIQGLFRGTAAWADAVGKRGQELFGDPIARVRRGLKVIGDYRPRPLAAGRRDPRPPINQIAARWAVAIEKQESTFMQALVTAEKARTDKTRQAIDLTPETLSQASSWMQANQAAALPLSELFRVVADGQSQVLRCAHEELTQRDQALEELSANIDKTRQELTETRNRAERFQDFTTRRLCETGFISSADGDAPAALTEAIDRFDGDIRRFPERVDYAWRLISLRDYLDDPRVQNLPYFRAAGLNDLLELLGKRRGAWQSIFRDDDPRQSTQALLGQWGFILQYLYRSRLLLRTYWPEQVDRDLWLRLDRAHAATQTILEQFDIHPHRVELLKPVSEVQQPGRIIQDDAKDLPQALENSSELTGMFEQLPYPDNEKVVVDIASWGIDCKAADAGQMGQTLLISRSKRSGFGYGSA
jgi:hypothetical protein